MARKLDLDILAGFVNAWNNGVNREEVIMLIEPTWLVQAGYPTGNVLIDRRLEEAGPVDRAVFMPEDVYLILKMEGAL